MKLESYKIFFLVIIMFFSVTTIWFAILSIANNDNLLFRICTQASLALTMLINGLQILLIQKKKRIAFFLIGVSAIILFVMVDTIIVEFYSSRY